MPATPATPARPFALPSPSAGAATAPPAPVPAPTPTPVPPAPPPSPEAGPVAPSALPVYDGPFGVREAERLLWRAGFGPSPGHAEALARLGVVGAVQSLTRPVGEARLTGPEPRVDGRPLRPYEAWGHDHLAWLDRMVRTDQPLVERMALVWHDWFACQSDHAGGPQLMLPQNQLFRRLALGSFEELVVEVGRDPAMIVWLNLDENARWSPNENYARELVELFTLGAGRDAYSEADVRELARAFTGWRRDWSESRGNFDFRIDPTYRDDGVKTIFGQRGRFDGEAAARACVRHPAHADFFVRKLWSSFVPVAPSDADVAALARIYVGAGHEVRPVLEAILLHPALHRGPKMVKPPVVQLAGTLRALRRGVDTEAWIWVCEAMGQKLFWPPDVAGWRDDRWLDTKTVPGRWAMVAEAMKAHWIAGRPMQEYDPTETADQAVAAARAFWGDPVLSAETLKQLREFADTCLPMGMVAWEERQYRASRQNALRQLIAASPDHQVC